MYQTLSERTPIARKKHRCIWCGQAIEVGEKYVYEAAMFEGNFQTTKWHQECYDAAADFDWDDADYIIPMWEMERGTAHFAEVEEEI